MLNMKGIEMAKKKIKLVRWSKAEVSQLKKIFPAMSTAKVAAKLKRSEKAVMQKAFTLGIKKTVKYLKSVGLR
jgi:hypothetical protein